MNLPSTRNSTDTGVIAGAENHWRIIFDRGQDEVKTDKGMDRINLKSRIVRRLLSLHISQSRRIWNHLSPSTRRLPLGCAFGRHLDRLVRLYSDRRQYFATFFLRNRPELDLLCSLANERPYGSRLNVCVLACSKGAEVYSIAWALRSARPDLKLAICAVDISQEIVEFASQGIYSFSRSDAVALADESSEKRSGQLGWNTSRDQNAWMFERMSKEEIEAIFDIQEETATVRAWLRDGIRWVCGNAGDPALQAELGPQNIVLANRFLCHMNPDAAER
ncbi:MAG: CheR family methyltransferase, partial [Terracidiphilus sp.]